MKITCQSCQAKYTIADEKVVGKTVKIKCKKCGAAIVVNANEAAAAGDAHAQGHEPEEDDGATRVFSGEPGQDPMAAAAAPTGGPDWTVNVRDDDQRTMSAAQIGAAFAAGTITGDTYVWRDGMADWLPLSQVAELQGALAQRGAPAPAAAAVPPPTDDDLNATVAMNPEAAAAHYGMPGAAAPAAAAAAPAAARKAARGGQDLFGGGGAAAAAASPFDAGGPPATNQLQKSLEQKAVGERNENSVLFSLASLTATEKAAAAPEVGPKKKPARSGLDDIMNMGGGGSMGAAMLAPPPIMAPVIEPPPQQMMAPAPATMPMQQPGMGAMPGSMPPPAMAANAGLISIPPPPQKKTPVGLIIGIVVGVLALGGVGIFLATSGGDKEATGENAGANSAAVAATSAAATNTAAPKPTATDTVAANNTAPTNTLPATDPGSTTKSTSGGTAPAGTGTGKPSGTAAPTASTAPTTAPTPTATAETPPPSGGGAEFNRAAASSALNAAAGSARGCKKPDGPTGTAKVKVTFAPSGNVTTSQVQGAPFAGTPVGGCIAAAFRSAKVPPFEGSPVSVSKSVTIN